MAHTMLHLPILDITKVNVTDSSNCVSDYDSLLVALNPPIIINPSSNTTVCP